MKHIILTLIVFFGLFGCGPKKATQEEPIKPEPKQSCELKEDHRSEVNGSILYVCTFPNVQEKCDMQMFEEASEICCGKNCWFISGGFKDLK